jgi:PAS domain S-box-containing protein
MPLSNPSILLIDDFAPDRQIYRYYLEADQEYNYHIFESESGEAGLLFCKEVIPDVILLDYLLPDLDGLEFLEELKIICTPNLPAVVMLTGEGNTDVAVKAFKNGASDYLIKGNLTADSLTRTVHSAVAQRRLQNLLEVSRRQQQLLASIALRIRKSLKLSEILQTTAEEVQRFLKCDRILVYQFNPDMSGTIVAESVTAKWTPAKGSQIVDTCLQTGAGVQYRQGRTKAIDNIYEANLTQCHIKLLEQFQVKANLIVPIRLMENYQYYPQLNPSPHLWGLLIVHQCADFYRWKASEMDFFNDLAGQLAIGIQQAVLFDEVQKENFQRQQFQQQLADANRTLEAQVLERTEALQNSNIILRSIIDSTPDVVVVKDIEGRYVIVNSTVVGWFSKPIEQIIGFDDQALFSAEIADQLMSADQRIMMSGESETYEEFVPQVNGITRTLLTTKSPWRDLQGNIIGIIAISRDISDRKQEELELQQAKVAAEAANQAKSTFIASMSHELRTPLNAIIGFAQLLKRSSNLNPDEQENTSIILKSGEHLLNLINQVLDVAKLEAGRTYLNETAFDFYRLLDELADAFQLKAKNKRLQLIFDYPDDVPQYIKTDALKLRQILSNLLSNAIKFTQVGGVSLRVRKGKDKAQTTINFEVEDTGSGIASEELAQLFQAFVQTQTGIDSQQGTGLGLVISQQFVQLMGGEISVSSEVDHGSIFRFNIAVNVVDAASIQTPVLPRQVIALEPNQQRYRILIVDDRSDNRQLLIKLLVPLGFAVKEANNGLEAIEVWSSWQPHLILMDLRMPVMDGYEATQQIKATTQGQATAIIAVSASNIEEKLAITLSVGCDGFIHKPFKEAEIFDALEKYLGVQYIYSELASKSSVTSTKLLTPETLVVLPKNWLVSFNQATQEANVDVLEDLLLQIQEEHESIANSLAELVDEYEFDKLLILTQLDD